jgi:hypothetical protein
MPLRYAWGRSRRQLAHRRTSLGSRIYPGECPSTRTRALQRLWSRSGLTSTFSFEVEMRNSRNELFVEKYRNPTCVACTIASSVCWVDFRPKLSPKSFLLNSVARA